MFGLVDGNNFYCSVERVFDPRLHGKPVVVASSNDGCVIARSQESKDLGVKMGEPLHLIDKSVRKQLIVRSANFGLYGDVSGRVVDVLRGLFPAVEVYSIDESFVAFDGIKDVRTTALEARARILKWTGIPTCVGIGPTKTLAKAGNKLAKKTSHGVVRIQRKHLLKYPLEDVWGVGPRWCARLNQDGLLTAADLASSDPETIKARYGVVLLRTLKELNGVSCAELEEVEPQRQQIIVSRSFGQHVTTHQELSEALATFAVRACEKLRARSLKANGVWVWANTNAFKVGVKQYHPSVALNLPIATSDTRQILDVAQALLKQVYRDGYAYKKCGIGLLDLMDSDVEQGDLFAAQPPRQSQALMSVLDAANAKFGRGAMGFASSGWRKQETWAVKRENLSPAYTSDWKQLMRVR
ncbi:Y-family DNA polymerase [Pseudoxanthomonas winnipegensis]|uniref:Y-family DNA polymerase n=1 Tax=Pseudoxanthomonas winnipegensis TaxID=2480810 RepID=A0A4Q8M4V7_9GAMM|nr:Y-family DNA polymerase [Pseudoxanthomonas winnipegensis]